MVTKGVGCLAPIQGGARHNRLCVFFYKVLTIFQDNVQNTQGFVEKMMKTGKKKDSLGNIFVMGHLVSLNLRSISDGIEKLSQS